MEFKKDFFCDEVRDGFMVPAMVKEAWGAQLEVLSVIDSICKKHNIPYWADWGTLLGAVRHGGFIPWDDDLDISMKRKDYEYFMKIAKNELPEGFCVINYATHEDFWLFLGRIINTKKACFEKEHLRKFHGFGYIAGVDIFVLDNVSRDEAKEEKRCKAARYVIALADKIGNHELTDAQIEEELRYVEKLCNKKLVRYNEVYDIKVSLYKVAEELFACVKREDSDYLTRMMPDGLLGNKALRLPQEDYEKMLWLPFENTKIPVPYNYDEMLRNRYGDYMKLVRDAGGHDYPFYELQKKHLQEVLDFEIPAYKYDSEKIPKRNGKQETDTAKGIIKECLFSMEEYLRLARKNIDALVTVQQLTIDLGNFIEANYNKPDIVGKIEKICENIFNVYNDVTTDGLRALENQYEELKGHVKSDILSKEEVVFLVARESDLRWYRQYYKKEMDAGNEVYVICMAYFYKDYDGALINPEYEIEKMPEEIRALGYNEFDMELHYPKRVYTLDAYEDFNPVWSIQPDYYCSNLINKAEKIIYITPFKLEEFSKESYRAYFNMASYCNMPGVCNADEVIVQSENMRNLYVEKLSEFAGENTRCIWEEKIKVNEFTANEKNPKKRVTDKKLLMIHVGISTFSQYGTKMTDKLMRIYEILKENGNQIEYVWSVSPIVKESLKGINEKVYNEFLHVDKMLKEGQFRGEVIKEDEYGMVCDGYYGDSSTYVQQFRNVNKPVMILNPNI